MTQYVKKTVNSALRLILHPLHLIYSKKNGEGKEEARMELPNHILLGAVKDAIREGHTATILVKGWSMRPFLEHQRDKVILTSPKGAKLYDAVLAELTPGKFVLHRIIDIKPASGNSALDEITLMGDGNLKETEHCHRQDICGIVTHYIRPNRTIAADDPKLGKDIRRWVKWRPIRRFLLIIYKAII